MRIHRPAPIGQTRLFARHLLEQAAQLLHLLRIRLGQIVRLGEIAAQVVELPGLFVGVPGGHARGGAGRVPRDEGAERAGVPAVAVDAAAGVVLEVLHLLARRRVGVVERVGQADAVHRLLLAPVDDVRVRDADQLVQRRDDVVHVVELAAHLAVGLDALRPRDRHRVARSAEVARHQLGVVERGVARPRPARVIHVVGLRGPQGVQAAEVVQRRELLRDGGGDSVLGQKLADGPALPLGAGAVVAEDVDDQRVLGLVQPVQLVQDAHHLRVDVLDEAGEELHQPALERPLRLGDLVPPLQAVGPGRQPGVGGDPPRLLLSREHALAVGVPAVVELPFVAIRPVLEDVVRAVRGARRPVKKERLVRGERLVLAQPVDRVIGQVFGQVVRVVLRRLDRGQVLVQARLPLRGLAGDEAVEVIEAVPRRPAIERSHRGRLAGGASCATCRTPPSRSRSDAAPRRPSRCSCRSRRCSRPSRRRARRSCPCARGGGSARSAATPASASRSTWCGTCCNRAPRAPRGRTPASSPRHRRRPRGRSRRRRAARPGRWARRPATGVAPAGAGASTSRACSPPCSPTG